jgi:hypothetical protein
MGPIGCPETSVSNYKSTLRNIPEKGLSHFYSKGSLKSSIIVAANLNRNARNSEGTHGKPRGDSTAYLWLSRLQCFSTPVCLIRSPKEGKRPIFNSSTTDEFVDVRKRQQ